MAVKYFDRNGTTAGFGTFNAQAWDTTTASWSDSAAGTATPTAYTFTNADTAQFGATGATATAGTVTISTGVAVTVNDITTQNLAGLQTIAAAGTGTLTLAGTTPTISAQSAGGLLISAPISGTDGFVKSGSTSLSVTAANSPISGLVDVQAGPLNLNNTTSSGAPNQLPNVSFKLANSALLFMQGNTAHTLSNDFVFGGAAGYAVSRNAGGVTLDGNISAYNGIMGVQSGDGFAALLIFASYPEAAAEVCIGTSANTGGSTAQVRMTHTTASGSPAISLPSFNGVAYTAILEDNGTASSSFSGVSTQSAAPSPSAGGVRTFRLTGTNTSSAITGAIVQPVGSITLEKQGTGKWALSGANTYTGTTTISAGTLSAQSSSALGSSTAGVVTVTLGTLELAGGIALDKGALSFALSNASATVPALSVPDDGGDNSIICGGMSLNNTQVDMSVGANAVLRLNNSAAITGATFGIRKVGNGELDLNVAANTYTGATTVAAGTLTVSTGVSASTNGPLGNASSAVAVSGTLKFDGASNSTISRSVQLQGSAPALEASGTGHIHFSAVSQASGSRTVTLKGTGTTNNQLQSALADGSGGTTGLTKDGAGKWSVTGTPSYTGLTTVNAGTLDFAGQDLTLAGDVSMAGGVLANGTLDNTLVTDVTFTGGTVQALLDGASTVTATSGTGRLYPVTSDGSNTYSGTTTVQAGATLELVTDSNPGTVGYGKVTGAGNVTVSGTLATGSGVNQRGQARYGGNLTFAAGSVLAIGAAA